MLTLLKKPFLSKFYVLKPKTIDDIKFIVEKTNQYVEKYLKLNEKHKI